MLQERKKTLRLSCAKADEFYSSAFAIIITMFRTRDFVLIFTAVVFLVFAIGSTAFYKNTNLGANNYLPEFTEGSEEQYKATIELDDTISREDRLAEMKKKIADSSQIAFTTPEVIEEEEPAPEDLVVAENDLQICSNYSLYTKTWSSNIKFEVAEGARVAYEESIYQVEEAPLSPTSTPVVKTEIRKEVKLQLVANPAQAVSPSCINSDVVGIAQDGSLIRNSEVGIYGVFGSATIVGYALDGFQIRGVSDVKGDACGGAVIDGQYVYVLSSERETILNCFKGLPANL